jgi:hypothetical protein
VPPSLNIPQLDFVKPSSGFHPVTWERVKTDGIMTEENSDGDDYADWIKWSFDAEENRPSMCESTRNVLGPVPL